MQTTTNDRRERSLWRKKETNMPELIWKGKKQVMNHHLKVPVRCLDRQYCYNAEASENRIIHGDNLEALKALLPEYEGRVKCIYIDPPYNTGNESWVYNDNVKDPRIVISGQFKEQAKVMRLPQFHIQTIGMSLFGDTISLFNKEELLKGFRLSQADSRIDFAALQDNAYRVDLEEVGDHDYKPSFWKLQHSTRENILEYLIALPPESRKKQVAERLCSLIGNMYPIADQEVKKYIRRIFEDLNSEQLNDCLEREYSYRDKIKSKIRELAAEHGEITFYQWLDGDRLHIRESYSLAENIHPLETAPAIPKSLYEAEGKLNNWEAKVINEIANLDNILFWHKIIERNGFCINGFINHYPDFLIRTKNGNTLLVEAKGDDRDNSDSARKLRLGKTWAGRAGNAFRYFMVFDSNALEGAWKSVV